MSRFFAMDIYIRLKSIGKVTSLIGEDNLQKFLDDITLVYTTTNEVVDPVRAHPLHDMPKDRLVAYFNHRHWF